MGFHMLVSITKKNGNYTGGSLRTLDRRHDHLPRPFSSAALLIGAEPASGQAPTEYRFNAAPNGKRSCLFKRQAVRNSLALKKTGSLAIWGRIKSVFSWGLA